MASNPAAVELDKLLDRYLERYSAKRVALSAILVGVSSVAAALGVYMLATNTIFAALAFGVTSLILINVCMIAVVPPTERLKESKRFLSRAVKDPSRIRSIEKHKITLLDKKGEPRELNGFEHQLWESVIVPAFMKNGMMAGQSAERPQRKMTASERRYVEEQKKLVQEKEKAVAEERARISEEQKRIQAEREELETRTAELKEAEDMMIGRLSEVETVQAELEQMREDVDHKVSAMTGAATEADVAALRRREDALRAKEAELEALTNRLQKDREAVEAQKTDLNQLKGQMLQSADASPEGTSERERELEKRLRDLEETNRKLEERSRYVEDVENSLIERLNSLSEREASVEQSEINAGMRSD